MCIAIYHPAGKRLEDRILENCFRVNRDGCGLAYINTDNRGVKRIKIKKSMDLNTFKRHYDRAVRTSPDSPFLLHFRIKTHGEISTFNCHPFSIDKHHVFIHNGVVPGMRRDDRMSDTQVFNVDYLKKLPKGWMNNEGIQLLIENVISSSKIVAMNIDGDVMIYNEGRGDWVDGVWYSNDSYKDYEPPVVYNYNVGKHNPIKTSSYCFPFNNNLDKPKDRGYSVGFNRFNGGAAEKKQGPSRVANVSTFFEPSDSVDCDYCSAYVVLSEMRSFVEPETSTPVCICQACYDKMQNKPDSIFEIDTETLLEFLNAEEHEEFDNCNHPFTVWFNPWDNTMFEDTAPRMY